MSSAERIVDASAVPEDGTYLFTVEDPFTNEREVVLVPCDDPPGVEAWINTCPHENQRFDRGSGALLRDGELVCPRHGSLFDACDGGCDNGPAAGTSLSPVEVDVVDGKVLLTDSSYAYRHDGGIDDDEGPDSTSHISL